MVAARYPGAVWRPISYRMAAGKFDHAPLGWIPHVTVMNGSPFEVFEKAQSPRRRFSHLWVSKTGHIEQYQDLTMKSWAQTDGNGDYWSVEFEGFPNEPYTDAQIQVAAQMHIFFGADDRLANKPGERGIGTHYMGGASYGGHSCPDPVGHEGEGPRSHQRQLMIDTANGDIMNWSDPITVNGLDGKPVKATAGEWLAYGNIKAGQARDSSAIAADLAGKCLAILQNPGQLASEIAANIPDNGGSGPTDAQVENAVRVVMGPLADLIAKSNALPLP